MTPDASQSFAVGKVDLESMLAVHRFSARDPMVRLDGAFCRATRTPDGPVTLAIQREPGGVLARAWGPGSSWIMPRVPALLGQHDQPEAFDPPPGPVRELHRKARGVRLSRGPWPWESLLAAIFQQRVQFEDAVRAYRALFRLAPEPAPGPLPLMLLPKPRTIAYLSTDALIRIGLDRKRAETLRSAALVAHRIDALVDHDFGEVRRLLRLIPGVGPWTVEMVVGFNFGDPDSVTVGDFHLPNTVAWALAGEARADDARMLELLEPYRGHRFRVLRLIGEGTGGAPKFGPRLSRPGPKRWRRD